MDLITGIFYGIIIGIVIGFAGAVYFLQWLYDYNNPLPKKEKIEVTKNKVISTTDGDEKASTDR